MTIRKKRIDKRLGEILVERGVLNPEHVQKALEIQKNDKRLIGEIIIDLGFATEKDIAQCIAYQYGIPYLPLENYEISSEAVSLVPETACRKYCFIPLDKIGTTLTIAMANPLDTEAADVLESVTSLSVQVFVSTVSDVRNAIERSYRTDG